MIRVYIGYDSRENDAYEVCRLSLVKHFKGDGLYVAPVKQSALRSLTPPLYWRDPDLKASTEFSLTRFLVPALCDYRGWALFMDCDMLVRADVSDLFALADPRYAVMCVQHEYTPPEGQKMDGATQYQYPRKNWSSVMLFNCEKCFRLTPEAVNTQEPSWLHQMKWADEKIGALPLEWNYLEGWNTREQCPNPKIVHLTRGGPWFPQWEHVEYGDEWKREREMIRAA